VRRFKGSIACTWSACRCVTMISESVQPVSSNALTIGASWGASKAAQAPVAGSWMSAPMLSDRQRKTRISAGIGELL
jgi:hypothetical protein